MFREIVKESTELGLKVKKYLDKGVLVPDKLTIELVKGRINKEDCKNGFIFDGFPRNLAQAAALDKIIKIDLVLVWKYLKT